MINTRRSSPYAVLIIVLTAALLTGCGAGTPDPTPTPSTPAVSSEHGDVDVIFAQQLIPHQQQAVQLSALVATKPGVDSELITTAERIGRTQATELTTVTGWLAAWAAPASAPPDAMGQAHDQQLLAAEELSALGAADTADGQRIYLQGMIAHQRAVVALAHQEIRDGTNLEALALARSIVAERPAEVSTLQQILDRS